MDWGFIKSPGYRIHFLRESQTVVALRGGNKDSQQRDIESAVKPTRN